MFGPHCLGGQGIFEGGWRGGRAFLKLEIGHCVSDCLILVFTVFDPQKMGFFLLLGQFFSFLDMIIREAILNSLN